MTLIISSPTTGGGGGGGGGTGTSNLHFGSSDVQIPRGLTAYGNQLDILATAPSSDISLPKAGTLFRMTAQLTAPPGPGNTISFEILINFFLTGNIVTISDPSTVGTITFSLPVAAGDLITVNSSSTGAPPSIGATVDIGYTA